MSAVVARHIDDAHNKMRVEAATVEYLRVNRELVSRLFT